MKLTRLVFVALTFLAAPLVVHGQSIGVNFGSEQPGGDPPVTSEVDGSAGVFGTSVWNNFTGSASTEPTALVDDSGNDSGASIEWSANGVWASTGRGEENNDAPDGNDRNLMTGYLDTGGAGGTVVDLTVSGLSYPSYDVAVYIQGGVNGRGGDYTIGDTTLPNVVTNPFDGTYVEGAEGNYLLFSGLSGDSFNLVTNPLVGSPERAPVNGIEIRLVPEPSSTFLMGFGLLGMVQFMRRRRR